MQRNDSGEYLIQLWHNDTLINTLETTVVETITESLFHQSITMFMEFEGDWLVNRLVLMDRETSEIKGARAFPFTKPIYKGETLEVTWHLEIRSTTEYKTVMKL